MNNEMMAAMLAAPDIMKCRKVLCIQPHPDDCEIGMGGIIGALAEAGCQVDYLTVTDGALGTSDRELAGDRLAALRKEEVEQAGAVLGVSGYYYFNYRDGSLNNIPELAGRIAGLVRENRYDGIFAPDPWLNYEAHWDHVVTGRAAAQAFICADLAEYPEGTATEPWKPEMIGFYFTASPNTYVDVSATFEKRFEAMAKHRTQLPPELLGMYRMYFGAKAQAAGEKMGVALAEGIRMMGQLHMHCLPEGEYVK